MMPGIDTGGGGISSKSGAGGGSGKNDFGGFGAFGTVNYRAKNNSLAYIIVGFLVLFAVAVAFIFLKKK